MLALLALAIGVLGWMVFDDLGEPRLSAALPASERHQPVVEVSQEAPAAAASIVNEPPQAPDPAPVKEAMVDAIPPEPARHLARTQAAAARLSPRKPAPARKSVVQTAKVDEDVALLAALVAHTNGQAQGRNRDIVERKDNDNTEALLARCQRLGIPESGLCSERICSGPWAQEAVCRTGAAE